jgi:phage terminase large subunit
VTTSAQLPAWAQQLWTPSRYKAARGGRGSGKSRSIATALVLQSAAGHQRVLCGREVQRSIKDSVKRLLDDEIDRLGLRPVFVSTETEIRGPNESLFLFSGIRGNAASLKSTEGVTRFWGEEASTFSQASLDTIIPTVRAPGSELWFSWNPDLETDPIDVMFSAANCPPDSIVMEVNHDDNPWFPDVLRREMEWDRGRDIDKYMHIWRGAYRRNSEARVFKNWVVEEFETPIGAIHRLGADFGFSVDPSVLVRCHIEGRKLFVDYEAYMVGCEIVNMPDLFRTVPDAEKWFITADSARPETISHLRNHGFPKITSALKGPGSLEEGVEFLKSFDIVVHPRCRHLIDELSMYSYKLDPLTGQVLPVLADKDNHVIDALRYACEGARRAVAVRPAPVSVPVPSMATGWNRARA